MVSTIALADAKASLSSVIKEVSRGKTEFIVTVRGVPQAMIVSMPKSAPRTLKAKGVLAKKRATAKRDVEKSSYTKALEDKYANPA